jgi:hypothetical protein
VRLTRLATMTLRAKRESRRGTLLLNFTNSDHVPIILELDKVKEADGLDQGKDVVIAESGK